MLQLSKKNRSELLLRAVLILFLVFWGLFQFWNGRFFEHYDDGVSYLDMADYFMRGQFANGFSCFWNPLYPMFIALLFFILRPDAFHEFMMLKLVNLIIFLIMLGAFEYFLNTFIDFYNNQTKKINDLCQITRNTWILLAHGIFAYSFLCLNSIATDTPDMMSNAFLFLAFTSVLKIYIGQNSIKNYFTFALFSGLAYLAKSAALPCMLVCIPFLWRPDIEKNTLRQRFIISITTLFLVILPYFIYLSIRAGEPILSPAAKLNYIWFVQDRTGIVLHQTHKPLSPELQHPMQQIYDHPSIFEFAQPVKGTYPPWFDPYYWYAGYKIHLCPDWLGITVLCNLLHYIRLFFGVSFLIALIIYLTYKKSIISVSSLRANAILFIPSLIGFLQYAFVINLIAIFPAFINRYFGFYSTLFILAALASLRIKTSKQGLISFKLGLVITGLCICLSLGQHLLSDLKTASEKQFFEHYLVASELQKLGLHAGDSVAQLGQEESLVDWARLSRLRIVADIPESKEFWALSTEKRQEIFSLLKKYGIKMIVYYSAPISKQSKALWKYNHLEILERMGWSQSQNKLLDYKTINPPTGEGWQQLDNLSCWVHAI